jgi:hypothetical protein
MKGMFPMNISAVKWMAAGVVAVGLFAGSVEAQTGRMVVVDLNRIFNEYYKTPQASAKLKETGTGSSSRKSTNSAKNRTSRNTPPKFATRSEKR